MILANSIETGLESVSYIMLMTIIGLIVLNIALICALFNISKRATQIEERQYEMKHTQDLILKTLTVTNDLLALQIKDGRENNSYPPEL